MPSVRDKYRFTRQDLQRADSVLERVNIFTRAWAWIVEASQTTIAFCGILLLPIYLITVGAVYFNDCGEPTDLPLGLILFGVAIFICHGMPPKCYP